MKIRMNRRVFLRASGVAIAMPRFESLARGGATSQSYGAMFKRRLVAINLGLGLHTPNLFPSNIGFDYSPTPYLESFDELRSKLTVISGTSHPDVDGGHSAELSFLSAAPHPGSASFRNTISIDQLLAREIGRETRYGYLALSDYGNTCSISSNGVRIPGQHRPSRVFEQLFLDGRSDEKAVRMYQLREGQSVLDVVLDQSNQMRSRLGQVDRQKMDEYLDAVRETERRLVQSEEWENIPKPVVEADVPVDIDGHNDVIGRARLMYELMVLAIQTDSTRLITYSLGGPGEVPSVSGVSIGYHNLSHHGRDPGKIEQLTLVEREHISAFRDFLGRLNELQEEEASLLDNTMVLLGSHMGNASSHDNRNLPILFAGGGFRHGQHLSFDKENNYPLCNLYVSILQRMGMEIDQFGSSTGTMRGLSLADS